MLRALKAYAEEQGIDCYLSLEERMACGIGACLACVCKSKDVDAHTNVKISASARTVRSLRLTKSNCNRRKKSYGIQDKCKSGRSRA